MSVYTIIAPTPISPLPPLPTRGEADFSARAHAYLTALREDVQPVSIRARHRWRAIRFARNSLLSNHIFDVQREHDDQAHLVARRRHKSTDQFQQTQ